MGIATAVKRALGPDLPVAVDAYDGSHAGPPHPVGTIVIRSSDAIRRFATAPGELGLVRAYVAGDIDVEGDLFQTLAELAENHPTVEPAAITALVRTVGTQVLRPIPPPPEEARLHGLRHSRRRDAAAVAYHYDVSNAFYELVLGPTLTYSCALWDDPGVGLEAAQEAKHELICQKLRLESGMRLLDVGCGWGSMALHAARHHGVSAVGVTVSAAQADLGTQRVKEMGLEGQVEIRLQDYRDIHDGPYDAISSIGMFEHVGRKRLSEYFSGLHALLAPGARLLNHGISRPAWPKDSLPVPVPEAPWARRSFINRYVFPDGELHELGQVISAMHQRDLEVRHVESLREHYALTLRAWVANLEANWDEAVDQAGFGRARVWRLYMAASAVGFEQGRLQVHQALATRADHGVSGFTLRPSY